MNKITVLFAAIILAVIGSFPAEAQYSIAARKQITSITGITASVPVEPINTATSTVINNNIEIRDLNKKLLFTLKHELVSGTISSFEFSRDGKFLVSTARTGGWRDGEWPSILGEARIWDISNGTLKRAFIEPHAQMRVANFSPNGKVIALGSGNGKIRLWDVKTGKITSTIPTSSFIQSLSFSPDGGKLVVAVGDKKVRVWNVASGRLWKIFDAEAVDVTARWIMDAAFSPDGKTIASAGLDPLRWWEVKSGRLIKTFENMRRETYPFKDGATRLEFPEG